MVVKTRRDDKTKEGGRDGQRVEGMGDAQKRRRSVGATVVSRLCNHREGLIDFIMLKISVEVMFKTTRSIL